MTNQKPQLSFIKKIYHLDNLYKKDEVFKSETITEHEKLSPTFLNFLLFLY